MHGFLANTDYDWFRFLRTRPELGEVNFWQPSGGARRKNGGTYYERDGDLIDVPKHPDLQPDPRLLEWHYEWVFRN